MASALDSVASPPKPASVGVANGREFGLEGIVRDDEKIRDLGVVGDYLYAIITEDVPAPGSSRYVVAINLSSGKAEKVALGTDSQIREYCFASDSMFLIFDDGKFAQVRGNRKVNLKKALAFVSKDSFFEASSITGIIADESFLYAVTSDQKLIRIEEDPKRAKEIARLHSASDDSKANSYELLAVDGKHIYLASQNNLFVVNKATGGILKTYSINDPDWHISSGVLMDGEFYFMASVARYIDNPIYLGKVDKTGKLQQIPIEKVSNKPKDHQGLICADKLVSDGQRIYFYVNNGNLAILSGNQLLAVDTLASDDVALDRHTITSSENGIYAAQVRRRDVHERKYLDKHSIREYKVFPNIASLVSDA